MAYVLYGFMKIILTLLNRQWYYDLLEAIFTFRRCVLNGLEVACYKICNLLLHKLARVCTSDVCKLYGYTCVCVVYVGCVFVWHGWYTLYITCMYTTSHVCIYVCVCCVAHVFWSHSLFTIYTSKHRSGICETGGRKPHISNPWSVVQSMERVMNIHCDRFNFSLNSEY